jgi:hypothetical protein
MIDNKQYPDAKCSVCNIPNVLAIELTVTDDGRILCEKCILDDKNAVRKKLAEAFNRLEQKRKDQEKIDKFW